MSYRDQVELQQKLLATRTADFRDIPVGAFKTEEEADPIDISIQPEFQTIPGLKEFIREGGPIPPELGGPIPEETGPEP